MWSNSIVSSRTAMYKNTVISSDISVRLIRNGVKTATRMLAVIMILCVCSPSADITSNTASAVMTATAISRTSALLNITSISNIIPKKALINLCFI